MRSSALFALLASALLAACDKPQPAAEIRPVRTVTAIAGSDGEPVSAGELVSLTGHIRARTEQSVAFRIDGRMISRRVGVGVAVRPGDLVAELDPQPKRDALREAQANLAAAEAAFHEASNNMERKRALVNQGWSTKVEFDAAERSLSTARAKVDAAKAQLHAAEDQLTYTSLLADAPGIVISTGAEAGEVVRVGQTIITVAHYDGVDAVFDVPATSQILGQEVRAAGIEAIVYPSSKTEAPCVAIFPDTLGPRSFVELIGPSPPDVETRLDATNWKKFV
jgi:multidrug efflux pump subunit AcrA (membrane-fusion protein)